MSTTSADTRSSAAAVPTPGLLALELQRIFEGPAWHGASVKASLKGVDHEEAQLRAGPGRAAIWEIALHLAYSRHRVMGRLTKAAGGKSSRFPRSLRTSWWPALPGRLTETAWRGDLDLLDEYQALLLETIHSTPATVLARRRAGTPHTLGGEVLGVVHHDAYHAGQVRLIRLAAGGADR